jgi:hypothetical protein
MKLARRYVFLVAVMLAAASNAAWGETWLCEEPYSKNKPPYKTRYVVTGDQMRAFSVTELTSGAKKASRVVRNDDRVLVAFFKEWKSHRAESFTLYLIIDKQSGTIVFLDDIVMNALDDPSNEFAEPKVEVGHCVQEGR